MNFNTVYNNHIYKFIAEEQDDKDDKDEDKESEEVEDKDGDKKKTKKDKPPDDTGNEIIDSKKIDLICGQVEINLVDTKEKFRIYIRFLDDAKFSGYVQYDIYDHCKRTFNGLNTVGEILNYINIHAEAESTITPTLNLLKREIIAIKRDMEPEEIAELALEFPV